jgi:hypothetical protein
MAKKSRRDRHQHEQPDHPPPLDYEPSPPSQDITAPANEAPMPKPSLPMTEVLEAIRSNATEMRRHNADTIAELEAWRAEIDAAIAYLKAGRR